MCAMSSMGSSDRDTVEVMLPSPPARRVKPESDLFYGVEGGWLQDGFCGSDAPSLCTW